MTNDEREELQQLEVADRAGQILTGAERGRLVDLRRAEILDAVARMLSPVNPATADMEIR